MAAWQPQAHSCRNALGTNMAGGSPKPAAAEMRWEPTCPPGSPGPTAPAMPRELTWPTALLSPELRPCPGNQHGRQQTRAHGSRHAPGTNMAGGIPEPTASVMTRNPSWPVAVTDPQPPPCPWNQDGRQQLKDHSSGHAPITNLGGGSPGTTDPSMPWETTWPLGSPWPTAPAMPREQISPPGSPSPIAPAMPWEPTWPAAASEPQLPPCPGNQHGWQKPQAHRSRHALGTNMADSTTEPTDNAVPREPTWPPSSHGKKAPTTPQEPTWPPGSPWPTAPNKPWEQS